MSTTQKELFKKKYRGYDERSVDNHIRNLQSNLGTALLENDTLSASFKEVKDKLEVVESNFNKLKGNIETRENAADEISRIALKEANLIVETANRNADSIVKESLATARQILIEMSNLGNEAIFLKKHVKDRMNRLAKVIDEFTLPNIPSIDCLDLNEEDIEKDRL